MSRRPTLLTRSIHAALAFALVLTLMPATVQAAPAPSKTAVDQTLAERDAQLAMLQDVVANTEVTAALAAHGLTPEEVNHRLAQLSPQELGSLAGQVDQLEAAGLNVPNYIWWLIAALIIVIIIA